MNPSSFAPEHFPPVRPNRREELSQSGVHNVDLKKQPTDQQKNLRAIHDRFAALDDTYGNADFLDDVTARPLEKHSDDDTHARVGNLQEIQNRFDALDRQYGGLNTFDRDFGRPPVRRPPPLPLTPTRSERQEGQKTYVREPGPAPRTEPFMKPGGPDKKTVEFFARKREITELIYEANKSFVKAEQVLTEAKKSLEYVTKIARDLDKGTGRLNLNANLEEVDNDILEDL